MTTEVKAIIETVLLPKLDAVRSHGGYWTARCPVHPDKVQSLGVKVHQDGSHAVVRCFAECPKEEILGAIGLDWRDLYPDRRSVYRDPDPIATYTYCDEMGTVLYRKVKWPGRNGKGKFTPYQVPDGMGGWRGGGGCMDGVRRVPFRLPQLTNPWVADRVWYCEGERDVMSLVALGEVATTSGSVSDWKPEFAKYFRGSEVIIVADKDAAGRKHACEVFSAIKPVAEFCWIVEAAEGKDASDHIRAGYGINDFVWLDCAPELTLPVTR